MKVPKPTARQTGIVAILAVLSAAAGFGGSFLKASASTSVSGEWTRGREDEIRRLRSDMDRIDARTAAAEAERLRTELRQAAALDSLILRIDRLLERNK